MENTSRLTPPSWMGLLWIGMEGPLGRRLHLWEPPCGSPGDQRESLGPAQDFWPRSMRGRQEVLTPRRFGGVESDV